MWAAIAADSFGFLHLYLGFLASGDAKGSENLNRIIVANVEKRWAMSPPRVFLMNRPFIFMSPGDVY